MSNEKSYNILNDFDPKEYNLLIPVQSVQEVNPIYRIVINQVKISTKIEDKEIYEERNAEKVDGKTMYALTHKGLLKLSTAANGQIVEITRIRPKVCEKCIDVVKATGQAPACGSCACKDNVACRVVMKFPELSGGWRIVQATREIDFSVFKVKQDKNDSGYSPAQLARMKEFASEQAESKAMSRCIRKGLNIKNAYTLDELKKPFVVAYPVLDARDQDVKKMLIAGAVAASNLLYGSKIGLQSPERIALPDGTKVDAETGEIAEDYEKETPATDGMPWEREGEQE